MSSHTGAGRAMADLRDDAYARYVSAFKADSATRDGRALRHYLRWCAVRYRPFLDALPKDARVLDLGCGGGDVLRLLESRGHRAEGIDISEEQVRLASRSGLNARTADAVEFLSVHPAAYDGIVALDFIEHFAKDELLPLLRAIGGALKPGGWLLIQTPNGQGLFASQIIYGDLTHMTILNPRSLRQGLSLAGFEDIRILEAGPAPLGPSDTLRSVLWPIVRAAARALRYVESPRSNAVWTENMIGICRSGLAPDAAEQQHRRDAVGDRGRDAGADDAEQRDQHDVPAD